MRTEMRRLVEASIDALPDAMRTVYVLRAIGGLTAEEAADALGLPQSTASESYLRTQRRLRDALTRQFVTGLAHVYPFAGARCDRIVAGVLRRLEELPPGNA